VEFSRNGPKVTVSRPAVVEEAVGIPPAYCVRRIAPWSITPCTTLNRMCWSRTRRLLRLQYATSSA
jgi:hypothetical protein